MKVCYTETALRELEEIFVYLNDRNRAVAAAVVEHTERLTTNADGSVPFFDLLHREREGQ